MTLPMNMNAYANANPSAGRAYRKSEWLADIGKRLRALREVNDLDQGQIAKLIAVDRTAWNKFENGSLLIGPHYVLRLSARFKISSDYVYAGHLIGVHPGLAMRLAERSPQLLLNTSHIRRDRGISQL